MRRWLSCILGVSLFVALSFGGCYVAPIQPCNRFDPLFDASRCPCTSDEQCPENKVCSAGTCTTSKKPPTPDAGETTNQPDTTVIDTPTPNDTGPPDNNEPDLPRSPDKQPKDEGPLRICTEGTNRPCYSGTDTTRGKGRCKEGIQTCTNNAWSTCRGEVKPIAEICNGIDDNCNGSTDEALSQSCFPGASGTPGVGRCKKGTQTCKDGKWGTCTGAVGPIAETCNGIDDDCNGKIDDRAGGCECTKNGASETCYGGKPGTEDKAPCQKGTRTCNGGKWSACKGQVIPIAEVCDNKDNDCDGQIDNGVTRPCTGLCGAGTETCKAGKWDACNIRQPKVELCNNIDDDCSGKIDDNIGVVDCYSGLAGTSRLGECRVGTRTCSGGKWSACVGEQIPQREICNGRDDDCDGVADNDRACGGCSGTSTRPCGTSRGVCSRGSQRCESGFWSRCYGDIVAKPEACNGQDDDCDGSIDEGLQGKSRINNFVAGNNRVDYLFVIDHSNNMQTARYTVSSAMRSFVQQLMQQKADFQAGLIFMDTNNKGLLFGNPKIITSQMPNAGNLLEQYIRGSSGRNTTEQAFEMTKVALSAPTITNQNKGFLRTDAMLVVFFLSNEVEQSTGSVASYAQFLLGLKAPNADRLLRVYPITRNVGGRSGCSTSDPRCPRFHELLYSVRGTHVSIEGISTSFMRQYFSSIATLTGARDRVYQLSHYPDLNSTKVLVNHKNVTKSSSNGWSQSNNIHAIQFNGTAIPKPGDLITIIYTEQCRP